MLGAKHKSNFNPLRSVYDSGNPPKPPVSESVGGVKLDKLALAGVMDKPVIAMRLAIPVKKNLTLVFIVLFDVRECKNAKY